MVQERKDERILRFFPVENDHPKRLTREQIRQFNEKGHLFPFDIYSGEEAAANRRYFDGLLEQTRKNGLDAYSINGYHTQCAGLWDVVTNPGILECVGDLLGSHFVCWGTHYFCKEALDPKSVPWHQDASYWPLTPSKTVTVWLAIDDADRENSAMKVIAGSHLHGHLRFTQAKPGEKVVLGQKVENAESYGEIVHLELKAGQISLHSDLLVHGSDSNRSTRRRCGLTLRYAPVDVRSTAGWNKESILCRGEDSSKYWANVPRPEGETVKPKSWQIKAG